MILNRSLVRNTKDLRIENKTLLLSPLSLALAACGGGGGGSGSYSGTSGNTSTNVTGSSSVSTTGTRSDYAVFGLTGDTFIDSMTQGSKWTPKNNTINVVVADGLNGEFFYSQQAILDGVRPAFTKLSDYLDINFNLIPGGSGCDANSSPIAAATCADADITISLDAQTFFNPWQSNVLAMAHFPDDQELNYTGQAGDLFLNVHGAANYWPTNAFLPGAEGFFVLIHELGHSLGLKHPHDSGGTGRPTFDMLGLSDYDIQSYTVMSYTDPTGSLFNKPSTFMAADFLALMWLYGPNEAPTAGDNIYWVSGFDRTTLYDSGGFNELNVQDVRGNLIALPNTVLSNLIDIPVGVVVSGTESTWQYPQMSWLLGEFNNVTCGSGNDVIFGNDNNNVIRGGAGNDTLVCLGGNDILYGGLGQDTFVFYSDTGSDVIKDFSIGEDSISVKTVADTENMTLVTYSKTSNGFAKYSFADGSGFVLEGVTSNVLSNVSTGSTDDIEAPSIDSGFVDSQPPELKSFNVRDPSLSTGETLYIDYTYSDANDLRYVHFEFIDPNGALIKAYDRESDGTAELLINASHVAGNYEIRGAYLMDDSANRNVIGYWPDGRFDGTIDGFHDLNLSTLDFVII